MVGAIICGALSWHLIEKKALELKKYFPQQFKDRVKKTAPQPVEL
jgi:peptidoglycan/LPS O-acetylase OafA/YrhL